MTSTIEVTAAGADPAAGASATLALNLALALSAIGLRVELRDARVGAPLARALIGAAEAVHPSPTAGVRLAILSGGGLRIEARRLEGADGGDEAPFAPEVVVLASPAATTSSSAATRVTSSSADLIVVPVSALPTKLGIADELARSVGEHRGPLRLVLPRVLGRDVDRWRLVEELDGRFPGAVCGITVPLGRVAGADRDGSAPTLYAPTGRAGKAYRALARLLAADLGLQLPAPDETNREGRGAV